MKIIRNIILFFTLMFTITSCEDWFYIDHIGKPVEFGITNGKTVKTRTVYSGSFEGNTEWIYWSNDDQVSIYMDWDDGSGYTGNPDHGIYNVNPGSDFHPDDQRYGRISHADGVVLTWHGDFSGGDGHAHEYPHTFYSAYPPTELVGGKFIFYLPSKQSGVNMKYAYMTAYASNVTSATNGDSHVELYYYPKVTTLYIAVVNDTEAAVGGDITLKSERSYISGSYSVDAVSGEIVDYEGESKSKEITNVVKNIGKDQTDTIAFFIRPMGYESGDLSLTFNGKEQVLDKDFLANYKYNIRIKVSGQEPDIEEPGPLPPLSAFVNGVISAEAHKRGYNWQFGEASKGEDPNKLYGEFQVWHDNSPWGGWYENTWMEVPPELLLEIIESIVDLKLTSTWEAKEITADDLNIFPNLKTIDINATNLESIEVKNPNITSLKVSSQDLKYVGVENCDGLTTFTVYSQMNLRSVTVRNNANLKDFTVEGSNNFSDATFTITCDSCPELTTFTWKGGDGWGIRYRKQITNCPKFGKETTPSGAVEQ